MQRKAKQTIILSFVTSLMLIAIMLFIGYETVDKGPIRVFCHPAEEGAAMPIDSRSPIQIVILYPQKTFLPMEIHFLKVEPTDEKKRPITFNYWYTGPSFGCVGPPGWTGDSSLYRYPTKIKIPQPVWRLQ